MVDCGTLTVEQPQANIAISDCSLTPSAGSTIDPADTVTATATVRNTGDATGTLTLSFMVNGQQFGSASVTVGAGGQETAQASFTPSNLSLTGSIDISVDEVGALRAGARKQSARLRSDGGRRTGVKLQSGCKSCGK